MKQTKGFTGHLWNKNVGYGVNWSGWSGTFTCQRCLSVFKASRPDNASAYEYEWMKDMLGKKVPKKNWEKCTADVVGLR